MARFGAALAALGLVLTAAAPAVAQTYRFSIDSQIKAKGYKFYIAVEPVKASAALEFNVKTAGDVQEISVKSMSYSWKTSGMDIQREVTPEKVVDVEKGKASTVWSPGEVRKGETNPLEVFGKPIGFLTPGGREPGVIVRSPDKYVRFAENFQLGQAPLLHRPALPAGELKQGQTFTVDTRMPDPTYSGIEWTVPVEWQVENVSGSGDDAVVVLAGAAAATEEKARSLFGRMTDGTLSFTSSAKRRLKSGELISAESRISTRWKRDPGDNPGGVLEDTAEALIRESATESK